MTAPFSCILDFKKQYSDNKSLVDGNTLKVKVASDIYVKKKNKNQCC